MFFSKRDARKIANKLDADVEKTRSKHEFVKIRYDGKVVASYGISRNSRDKGHDYIPRQLHISNTQAKGLSDCTFSKEDFFDVLREKGFITEPEPSLH